MSLFKLVNVNKQFQIDKSNSVKVINNLSCEFPNKGLVCVIGKSGCGKSTLLNLLGLLDKPTNGKIYYNNEDVSKWKERKVEEFHNEDVGIIFQQYNLIDDQSVLYNVALPMMVHGEKKKKSYEDARMLLEGIKFNKELWDKRVNKLSGGERQRIAILRSLINSPKVLLCDEPTGALDSENSILVMDILKKASLKRLVIVVSHNVELVKKYADRIITLDDGKIVKDESINSIDSLPYLNPPKRKRLDEWSENISFKNFKRRFRKNILSIISLIFCLTVCTLITGFTLGYKDSIKVESKKHLDYGCSTISKEYKESASSGVLSLVRQVRPSLNEIKELEKDHTDYVFVPSYDALILSKQEIIFNEEKINSIMFNPIYSFTENYIDKSLLIEGRFPRVDNFYEVVVNKSFINVLKMSPINLEFTLKSEWQNIENIVDEEYIQIIDYFSLNREFKIVGVVDELSFLSTPTIYYSYKAFEEYLSNVHLENYSEYLGYEYSWKEKILFGSDQEDISSYSYRVFSKNYSKNLANIDNFAVNNNSNTISDALEKFLEAASIGLYLFLIISIIGTILILGSVSFSSYAEDRKRSAILSSIGVSTNKIMDIYIEENLILCASSILISIIISPLLIKVANFFIQKFAGLSNMIIVPNKVLLDFSFSYYFILIILCLFICLLTTIIPIKFSKKISVSQELKTE